MEPALAPARRRRLTYANVTATLALFIALGGSSFAEPARQSALKLVTGKQIKNGSVAEVDLSGAVKAKLNKAGTPGAPGAKGDAGPKGETGAEGPAGPAGTAGTNATVNGVAASGALAGTYPAPTLAPGAVTTAALGAAAVTPPALAANAVTTPALATNAVTASKVADQSLRLDDIIAEDEILSQQNLPSIPAHSCTEFEINVVGSGTGYFALISPPGNFYNAPGLVFDWTIGINAGEDIEVHVCNTKASAIDPPAGGWRAVVLRP